MGGGLLFRACCSGWVVAAERRNSWKCKAHVPTEISAPPRGGSGHAQAVADVMACMQCFNSIIQA